MYRALEVRAEALREALANTLAEMASKKFGVTFPNVQGIVYAMGQSKADTLVDRLSHV